MLIVFKAIYAIIATICAIIAIVLLGIGLKCVKHIVENNKIKKQEAKDLKLLSEKIKDVQKMAMSWQIGSQTPVSVYNLNTKMFTHYKEIYDALSEILTILPNSNENTKRLMKIFVEDVVEDLIRDNSINKKQRLDIEIYSIPLAKKKNAVDLVERLEDECVGELENMRIAVLKVLNALREGCVFTNVNFTGSTAVSDDKEKVFSNNDMHKYTENDLDKIQNSLDVIKKYCVENDDMGILKDILDLLNLSLEISKNADDSRMYKKFNTYYLPEMLNMIEQLAELLNARKGACLSSYANDRIEKIKQMLYDLRVPFEKILESLMDDDSTKIDVDLETMRDMLKMDGLLD